MKKRLDNLIAEKFPDITRSQAKNLIQLNQVHVNKKLITKPGEKVEEESKIEIITEKIYVSRAAQKLLKALEEFPCDLNDKVAADIGASTGGFTEVLLENGVKKVYAIDVGHDQLHEKLNKDTRVVNLEKKNIKYPLELDEKVDICVSDLSYISLTKVFHNIWSLLNGNGFAIVLIKPQFEAGKGRLGKDAVLRDKNLREQVLKEVLTWFEENNYLYEGPIESPIQGKDGNIEYLIKIIAHKNN